MKKFFTIFFLFFFLIKNDISAITVIAKVGDNPITNYDVEQVGFFLHKNKSNENDKNLKNTKIKKDKTITKEQNIDLKKSFSDYLQFLITLKLKEIYIQKAEISLDETGNKEFLKYAEQVDKNIKYSKDKRIDQKFILNMLKIDFIWNAIVYQSKAKQIEEIKKKNQTSDAELTKTLNEASLNLLLNIKNITPVDIFIDLNEKDIFN